MKTILFAILGVLAVAVIGWVVKSQLDRPDSQAALAEAKNPAPPPSNSPPTSGPRIPSTGQPHAPIQVQTKERMETVWTTPTTRQAAATPVSSRTTAGPARQPANSAVPRNAQPASPTSPGSPAYSYAPSSSNPSTLATPSVNPVALSGTEPATLELDPGVPVPAALLPAEGESQSPTVAAAQQQIADSFVQEVDNALSQPETANSDEAASEAYYDSLTSANELYRALYGDQAYNNRTMQATLESQAGN